LGANVSILEYFSKCPRSLELITRISKLLLSSAAAPRIEYDRRLDEVQTLKTGGTLVVKILKYGVPAPTINWFQDDKPLKTCKEVTIDTTGTTSVLTVRGVVREDAGKYKVALENVVGEASADFAFAVQGKNHFIFKTIQISRT
jgi:hypothetical protein